MLLNLGRAPGQAEPRQAAPLAQLQQTGRDARHSREQEELQARHSGCSISISVLREQGPVEKDTDKAEGAVKKSGPLFTKTQTRRNVGNNLSLCLLMRRRGESCGPMRSLKAWELAVVSQGPTLNGDPGCSTTDVPSLVYTARAAERGLHINEHWAQGAQNESELARCFVPFQIRPSVRRI